MNAKVKMVVAMVSFGTIGIFVKKIPLSSAELALYRGMIALFVLLIYMILSKGFSDTADLKGHLGKLLFNRRVLY